MISLRIPWRRSTCWSSSSSVSAAKRSLDIDTKWAILEKPSTIIKITMFSLNSGRLVMKSRAAMGLTGVSWGLRDTGRRPSSVLYTLRMRQYASTSLRLSPLMAIRSTAEVDVVCGWVLGGMQVLSCAPTGEPWSELTPGRSVLGGAPSGMDIARCASLTCSSILQVVNPTTQEGGRIVYCSCSGWSLAKWCESVSG